MVDMEDMVDNLDNGHDGKGAHGVKHSHGEYAENLWRLEVARRLFRMDKVVGKVDNVHLAYHWTWWTICLWWTICT